MLRLTRDVRFTLQQNAAAGGHAHVANGLSGNLHDAFGMFLVLRICIGGEVDPVSNYIENIKTIDESVRSAVVPRLSSLAAAGQFTGARAARACFELLRSRWPRLDAVELQFNPFLSFACIAKEAPMVRVTQRFEFSAAHRLHNPAISDADNLTTFGKCNNPEGHGHNYEFDVTLAGEADAQGHLIDLATFADRVQSAVIERFDHKHLNRQTAEFAQTIPSVENIARVIFELLRPHFTSPGLQSVRVWETGKTSAEYCI